MSAPLREVQPLTAPAEGVPPINSPDDSRHQPGICVNDFLDSKLWTGIIIFCTVWALYSSDFTFLFLGSGADVVVAVISILVTIIFVAEMSLNFALKRDYGAYEGLQRFNMYFWVDLVGTASLIPEIMIMLGSDLGSPKVAAVARAGRAARIGARFARVVRFIRG